MTIQNTWSHRKRLMNLCNTGTTNITKCCKEIYYRGFSQDFWKRRLRQEHQGWRLCTNRKELCQSQMEGKERIFMIRTQFFKRHRLKQVFKTFTEAPTPLKY